MSNDQHTAYHVNAIAVQADTLLYSRYPEPEAEACIAYDEACIRTIQAHEQLEKSLDDLLYYQRNQPAMVNFQWQIVQADKAAIGRAEAEEAAARRQLDAVRVALREGRL